MSTTDPTSGGQVGVGVGVGVGVEVFSGGVVDDGWGRGGTKLPCMKEYDVQRLHCIEATPHSPEHAQLQHTSRACAWPPAQGHDTDTVGHGDSRLPYLQCFCRSHSQTIDRCESHSVHPCAALSAYEVNTSQPFMRTNVHEGMGDAGFALPSLGDEIKHSRLPITKVPRHGVRS